jgi:hypothetical protein
MNILDKIIDYKTSKLENNEYCEQYVLSRNDMQPLVEQFSRHGIRGSENAKFALSIFTKTGDYEVLANILRGSRILGVDLKLEMDMLHPIHGNPFNMC